MLVISLVTAFILGNSAILDAFNCIEHVDADIVCEIAFEDNSVQYVYIFIDPDYIGDYSADLVKGSTMEVLETYYYHSGMWCTDSNFYEMCMQE